LTLIFDREGYSPDFFAELKAQRIAILTYHKFPGKKWLAAEFSPQPVRLHNGQIVELELAERSNGLWVREVRQLRASGAQSSILSTNMRLDLTRIAARWSQENFLKYMREHYGPDRLIEYGTLPLPETLVVVNPPRRRLDQSVRRERARLFRLQADFGARPTQRRAGPEFRAPGRRVTRQNPSSRAHAQRLERKTPTNTRQTDDQGVARDRTLRPTQDREEALHRYHQTHCLPRRERLGGRNPRR
jgi:hypothetical protein